MVSDQFTYFEARLWETQKTYNMGIFSTRKAQSLLAGRCKGGGDSLEQEILLENDDFSAPLSLTVPGITRLLFTAMLAAALPENGEIPAPSTQNKIWNIKSKCQNSQRSNISDK